jgi:hypothetical protein
MSESKEHKTARVRSPAYPAFDLRTAIEKARTIYQQEKRAAAPVSVVTKHCGLDISSSSGLRLIAALKQFALAVEQGSGEDRKIQLSPLALDILIAPSDDDPKRITAIQRCALSPKVHRRLWEHYKGELPSDANIGAYLVRELNFNDAQVNRFIREFRSTIAYAQLAAADIMTPVENATDDINDDEGETAPPPEQPQRRRPVQAQLGFKQATFPLNGGEALVQWPENISPDEFEDFQDWLELVIRKVKRSVSEPRFTPDKGIQSEDNA